MRRTNPDRVNASSAQRTRSPNASRTKQKLHERCLAAALTPGDENARTAPPIQQFGKKVQNKPNVTTGQTKQRRYSF
jgi:hypothetical protein